jgi:hypothetical protein
MHIQIEGSVPPGWYPIGKLGINGAWAPPYLRINWEDLTGRQTDPSNSGLDFPATNGFISNGTRASEPMAASQPG